MSFTLGFDDIFISLAENAKLPIFPLRVILVLSVKDFLGV
jgi:hypothetical protein